jgi:tetratricopeptide (TPR) repeat protein
MGKKHLFWSISLSRFARSIQRCKDWTSGQALVRFMLLVGLLLPAYSSAREIRPSSDDQVLETLTPRAKTSSNPGATDTPQARIALAQEAILLTRQTSDPRHLGRAQAALSPWWDKADAPAAVAILQATIQQSRHEFAPARRVLAAALARDPKQAQGWLTLANLERVVGQYPSSLKACEQVAASGERLYALACQWETRSMLGEHAQARTGFNALLFSVQERGTRAWILSLLAENEERSGDDAAALKAFQQSLALAEDTYTTLAMADLLLRTERPGPALAVLQAQPNSDGVLIRRAFALKQLKDPSWKELLQELSERFQALERRGDDPAAHARERALVALWLENDPAKGLKLARLNLEAQKEPADWLIAAQLLQANKSASKEIDLVKQTLRAQGLVDARVSRWLR